MTRFANPLALAGLTAAAIAAAPLSARAQSLSPQEQRIVAYVNAHTEDAIDLLERTVNINSGTMNAEGVRAVGKVYRAELDSLGLQTRWIELPDSMNRGGHLFAKNAGDGKGKTVLLIGHLDTVFEEDSPFQTFVRTGDTAKGPGVNDMKGGDVVIIYALKALQSAGALDDAEVIVAFTGDEESVGTPIAVSRQPLIDAAQRSDVALEFESGSRDENGQEYGVTARRGFTGWTLKVSAKPGHSSGIFSEEAGSGAIYEAARILNEFREELRGEPNLTFSPGIILGGTEITYDAEQSRGTAFGKTNVIPGEAVVAGDIRAISNEQLERTEERMRKIVAQNLPQTHAEITFATEYPGMPPTAGNQALLDELNEINRDLGAPQLKPFDPGKRGAADVSFVAPYVDALAGLGVYGSGGHTVREDVDLATLPLVIQRAALLIYRLTR